MRAYLISNLSASKPAKIPAIQANSSADLSVGSVSHGRRAPRRSVDQRGVDELAQLGAQPVGAQGISWVKNDTVSASAGSTQNAVLATPPQ